MTLSTIAPAFLPPAPAPEGDDIPTEPIWRLTVEQYHEMIRRGILMDGDPVELLEGWLVAKMSQNPPHRIGTRKVRERLNRALPEGWYVDAQEPVTTSDSEPEPDVSVIRGTSEDYFERHPGPAETALVVEVADASLRRDRTLKKRAYARAGVATYWIVNLNDRIVEVYTKPTGPSDRPDYLERRDYREGEAVPFNVGGQTLDQIPVSDLLPPVQA